MNHRTDLTPGENQEIIVTQHKLDVNMCLY